MNVLPKLIAAAVFFLSAAGADRTVLKNFTVIDGQSALPQPGSAMNIVDGRKPVDDELIQMMKKRGAWQMAATLTREASTFVFDSPSPMLDDPFFAAEPDDKHGREWLEMAKKNLKKLVDSGVKCGFGIDTGPPRCIQGYFEQWEMVLMADAGLTPQQIITMATKNSAEFLGASPLDNIKNTPHHRSCMDRREQGEMTWISRVVIS
jgi:hypothetical protein